MLLATIGLYGAISSSVSERRRELGIRIALGARPGQLMQLVFRETLIVAGAGMLAGLSRGIAAATNFPSQIYGGHSFEWFVLSPGWTASVAVSPGNALRARWASDR